MKKLFSKFNPNWIAVFLLLGAFIFSAVRFYWISKNLGDKEGEDGSNKIVRVAHWQLEPGFREAFQWAIDEYNNLPHVQEAGVTVMQTPISERVYAQFMNVHLISGTAPDVAAKRETELIRGNALAKFYAPLGSYTEVPNPYNAPKYQHKDLPEELSDLLADSPWRDTFFDGLQGGYEEELSDYYAITTATWGGIRLFYNLDILENVKSYARGLAAQPEQPDWMKKVWRTEKNDEGYLPESAGREWLETDQIPQTLGQFLLYINAVHAYAKEFDDSYLIPIASSSYSVNDIANSYQRDFLVEPWKEVSMELGQTPTALEGLSAFEEGVWDFNSPFMDEMLNFSRDVAQFYPQGFLGLGREQAQRRFVLGQAAVISTGGWDANSIFMGIKQRDNPEDRFDVEVAPKPVAVEGERWFEFVNTAGTEANATGGVPLAINKQSRNFDWALDFLRFVTSHRINEDFAARAGWLPVIVGAEPPESMAAFMPFNEGIPLGLSLKISESSTPPNIRNAWSSNLKTFMTGDTLKADLVARVTEEIENPVTGIDKAWINSLVKAQDQSRANQRSMSVERLNAILGDSDAARRERANTYINLIKDEGVQYKRWWHELHPDEPYPEY